MKIERLISIIMLLLERKTISASELARTFEVSTRTIYRDIDAIDRAGIPIVTYPGIYGGIGIMEEYKINKRIFTITDITLLLRGLGGISTALSDREVAYTLAKIRGMVPAEQLAEIESQSGQIAIELNSWSEDESLAESMQLIKAALANHEILNFQYKNAAGEATEREAEPYRLLYKGSAWYLQGYCCLREEYRTFRLSRMEALKSTGNQFDPRPFAEELARQRSDGNKMLLVDIQFHKSILRDVLEFYGNCVVTTVDENTRRASIPVMDNEIGYRILLAYGDQCECLGPAHVRKYLAEQTRRLMETYRKEIDYE